MPLPDCSSGIVKFGGGVMMQSVAIDTTDRDKTERGFNWNSAIWLGMFHVGAIAALFVFSWKWLLVSLFLNWVGGSLGIGIGFHRLLTHRGFRTPKWVEY